MEPKMKQNEIDKIIKNMSINFKKEDIRNAREKDKKELRNEELRKISQEIKRQKKKEISDKKKQREEDLRLEIQFQKERYNHIFKYY